jgi:uncharacterized protein (DUF1499 family)
MKIAVIIVVVLILLFVASLVFSNMKTPSHLGHKGGKLAPMPSKPNAVSSQTGVADKRVEALPLKDSPEATLAAVVAALNAMGGNEIQAQEANYLYTIFTTSTMHFHDDVEFLIDEANQQLQFRSQSRAGYSDMGVNRQRYERFRALYVE